MKKLFLVTLVMLSAVLASANCGQFCYEPSNSLERLMRDNLGQSKYMNNIGAYVLGAYIDAEKPVNCQDAEILQSLSRISRVNRAEYQRDLRWLDTLAQHGENENQKQFYTNVLHCEAGRIGLF